MMWPLAPAVLAAIQVVLRTPSATVEVQVKAGFARTLDLDAPLNHLLGIAEAAGEGVVTPEQVRRRAYQRPGDLMENVPGLLVSQHSGEGKANQFYLRGFNLDHGTDLRTTVAGMPVNLPSHAHGQGYTDLGFLIPELVTALRYRKGAHFAEEGDFATAGAVHLDYAHVLPEKLLSLEGGARGYGRALWAGSAGGILWAAEGVRNDGPWEVPEAFRKSNLVLRWSGAGDSRRWSLTAMSYGARWTATDQVPQRALDAGRLASYGSLDPTDGGSTFRRSLSGHWMQAGPWGSTEASGYLIHQQLRLYSNFTWFLEDPVRGDQFEQLDRRTVAGGELRQRWEGLLGGLPLEVLGGLQVRQDQVTALGLYRTAARSRTSTIREDRVRQGQGALFLQARMLWSESFRSTVGLRADRAVFRVESRPAYGASLLSPKVALAFGPWKDTEFYLNAGSGFHSNDARGVADGATPLVRARSLEAGLRTAILPAWQSTLALWWLDLDSELVFVGDAGTTEPGPASHRRGLEWANEVRLGPRAVLQLDLAWARARHLNGDRVPGAVGRTATLQLSLTPWTGAKAGLGLRHVGARDLTEDGRARSKASTLLQASFEHRTGPWIFGLEAFNLSNARTSDIEYRYVSRLPGEAPAGVEDTHTHPAEPFTLRVRVGWRY